MAIFCINGATVQADTVTQLKARLKKAKIAFPRKATKAELEKLLAESVDTTAEEVTEVESAIVNPVIVEVELTDKQDEVLPDSACSAMLSNCQGYLEFLQLWAARVGFHAKRMTKVIYRSLTIDTSLIFHDVIFGDFDRIELHGFDSDVVSIKTCDGFTVVIPRSFFQYVKEDFQNLKTIDLSKKSFATANAVYVVCSALAENLGNNNLGIAMAVYHDKFEVLAIKYWGEIMLLAQHLGVADDHISSLRDFLDMSIHRLVAQEVDNIITEISAPFSEEADLKKYIEDIVLETLQFTV